MHNPADSLTIQQALDQASVKLQTVSESARLDAEVLLCHCLHKTRSFLRAWPEQCLTSVQSQQFWQSIQQRQAGYPVAYLTGEKEFWSRNFKVSPDVLIPRPDSELLIELSLELLNRLPAAKILDLGTGSGILAITLAAECPSAHVIATDICAQALAIAQQNARQLQTHNVAFIRSDWFAAIQATQAFDLIISNPPYIPAEDPHLGQGDVRFEPSKALISAEQGLHDIRLLATQARQHLKNPGYLLIEHGYDQAQAVQQIFTHLNYQQVQTHHDLSGNPRVTSGLWNPT